MKSKVVTCALMILAFVAGYGLAPSADPETGGFFSCAGFGTRGEGPFGQGRLLVTRGRYQEALTPLSRYLAEYPRGRNSSRAAFFTAKAHVGLGDLRRAADWFERTIRDFPATDEARKCRYKLAMIHMWSGRTDLAVPLLERMVRNPDGPLVPEARAMLNYLKNNPSRGPLAGIDSKVSPLFSN